jgi:hypothetical protein
MKTEEIRLMAALLDQREDLDRFADILALTMQNANGPDLRCALHGSERLDMPSVSWAEEKINSSGPNTFANIVIGDVQRRIGNIDRYLLNYDLDVQREKDEASQPPAEPDVG